MEKKDYKNFCLEHPATSSTKKQLENLYNRSVERDSYNNEIIWTFTDRFLKRYATVLNSEERHYPKDSLMMLSDYLLPPLHKIAANPKTQLVKNNVLQKHHNVRTINNKTMQWLEGRSGKTLKEKIGNTGKVMAPISSYTADKKENRITTELFKKIEKMLEIKYSELSETSLIESTEFKEIYEKFHRMKKMMKDNGLYYLDRPKDFTPNNALIDHRDYSKVFRGLKLFNRYIENYGVSRNEVLENSVYIIFWGVCARLEELSSLKVINYDTKLKDIFAEEKNSSCDTSITFAEENTTGENIEKLINFSCTAPDFGGNSSFNFKIKCNLETKVNLVIKLKLKNNHENKSGITVNCIPLYRDFILNEEGIKEFIDSIFKAILEESRVPFEKKISYEEKIKGSLFLNFFSPVVLMNGFRYKKSLYYPKRNLFLDEDQHYDIGKISSVESVRNISGILRPAEGEKIYKGGFLKFIESLTEGIKQSEEDITVYSMAENITEDMSSVIFSTINKNFQNAVPVWRSILAVSNPKIAEDMKIGEELFILDLNNPEISLNIVKNNRDAPEHHPQLSIESDTFGLSLRDFAKEYLEKYLSQKKILINSSEKEYILNSYKFYEVICKEAQKATFIKDFSVIEVEYDPSISEELQKIYSSRLGSLLEKEEITKLGKKICIIGDHLSGSKSLGSRTAIIKEISLIKGYETVLERAGKEEVLWKEYLPDLSLETTKGKHFYNLKLIKDKSFETRLGKAVELDVDENLELHPNGRSEYLFPVNSQNFSEKKEYFLKIRSAKNFPLKSPVRVKIKIKYCYGQSEPYKFIFELEEGIINDFKAEIIGKEFILNIKKPGFPEFVKKEKTQIITLLDALNDSFKNQILGEKKFNSREFEYLIGELGGNKNKIRNYLRTSDTQEHDIRELKNHPFITGSLEFFQDESSTPKTNLSEKDIKDFKVKWKIFIASFGAYGLSFLPKDSIRELDKKRLLNFAFSSGEIGKVLSLFEGKYIYSQLYPAIAYSAWIEKDFVENFYDENPELLKECLAVAIKEFFSLNKEILKKIKDIEKNNGDRYYIETNKFKDILKFLLAIFRLGLDDEKMKQLGLRKHKVKQLIFLIKDTDRKIRIESENEVVVKNFDQDRSPDLKIEKPEDLSAMSDLAYAAYLYLIGDNKADLISIRENDEE
ncbi:MAG: hypothetical protein ACRCTS_03715 [Fusobacteriaceae bacterium]